MSSRARKIRAKRGRQRHRSVADGYALAPGDGTPLYFSIRGNPAGPPLLFCDGIGCDGYVWKYVWRDLGERYRLVHWHYRGHGRSRMPRDPECVGIEDLVEDLTAVLDEAAIDRAVVFGHSMGVQVALETARAHRDRLAGLVLMCGAPGRLLRTFRNGAGADKLFPLIKKALGSAPRLLENVWRTVMPTNLSFAIAQKVEVNGSLLEQGDFMPYLRGLARVKPELFLAMLERAAEHDATDLLPGLDLPALVVAGDRDGFTPSACSEQMCDALPRSQYLLIEGGSHTAPLERPELVADALARYLASVPDLA